MWKLKTNASMILRKFTNRLKFNIARTSADAGLHMDRVGSRMTGDVAFTQNLSRHRSILPLYDLKPVLGDCWIAPNATVVGQVYISTGSSIWYNAVLRGEINAVRVGLNTMIGDQTVIHTAASLPTGIPASVNIGKNVIIQSNCSIYSATIDDDAFIGSKSVILQGAKVQRGAVVAPNSVVPPGRLIPSNQLWAGNPVEYVRDLDLGQLWANYTQSYVHCDVANQMKDAFSLWPGNYLKKQSTQEDTSFQVSDSIAGSARNLVTQKQATYE